MHMQVCVKSLCSMSEAARLMKPLLQYSRQRLLLYELIWTRCIMSLYFLLFDAAILMHTSVMQSVQTNIALLSSPLQLNAEAVCAGEPNTS